MYFFQEAAKKEEESVRYGLRSRNAKYYESKRI